MHLLMSAVGCMDRFINAAAANYFVIKVAAPPTPNHNLNKVQHRIRDGSCPGTLVSGNYENACILVLVFKHLLFDIK